MKRYFPKNAEDASALILTLLVIVLLSTIVTSFLSSTRTEQTATRNYTSKTQAEQFATSATQQAMATLQGAFNGNGTGTGVVTSQPGRITKYFFQNGTCTQNATNLFSENGSLFADMNNLSDPASNSSRTNSSSFLSITGNAAESLKVALVNMTSGNKTIGRIAYYIDDEGTKINLNSATSNRSTINAVRSKAITLPTAGNFSGNFSGNKTIFDNIVNGLYSGNGNVTTWSHFFRQEQVQKALGLTNSEMANYSTAPLGDYHLKYTPWGTSRIFINDESIDDIGVNNIYNALTSGHLKNIYGMTFSNKYSNNTTLTGNFTLNGVKQIAANMLQMRDLNTLNDGTSKKAATYNRYRGKILWDGTTGSNGIPSGGSYFAHTPYACINEVGIQVEANQYIGVGNHTQKGALVFLKFYIELVAPYGNYGDCSGVQLSATIKKLSFQVKDATGIVGNPTGLSSFPQTINMTIDLGNVGKTVTNGMSLSTCSTATNPETGLPTSAAARTSIYQFLCQINCFNNGNVPELTGSTSLPFSVVGPVTVEMGDIVLRASSSADSIRDWVEGSTLNTRLGDGVSITLKTPITDTFDNAAVGAKTRKASDGSLVQYYANSAVPFFNNNQTLQRVDPRIKGSSAWLSANYTLCRNSTQNVILNRGGNNDDEVEEYGDNTYWGTRTKSNTASPLYNKGIKLRASDTRYDDIPGDPSSFGWSEPIYFNVSTNGWTHFWPKLHAMDSNKSGLFTCPADLGKVITNFNFRSLRFMPQHKNERINTTTGNSGQFIPDWAMLDVISFTSNNSTNTNFKLAPININGAFACNSSLNNSNAPKPRNNLANLLAPIDSAYILSGSIKLSASSTNMTYDEVNLQDPNDWSPNYYGIISTLYRAGVTDARINFRGSTTNGTIANSMTSNMTAHLSGNASIQWSQTGNDTWSGWRATKGWPSRSIVLPAESTEIKSVADFNSIGQYAANWGFIKQSEGRLSAIFPGLTTCSNFFTIFAYAQALDKAGNVDSEHLTKTLVEVEITTPATATSAAVYKVKSLYTQSIPMGD